MKEEREDRLDHFPSFSQLQVFNGNILINYTNNRDWKKQRENGLHGGESAYKMYIQINPRFKHSEKHFNL